MHRAFKMLMARAMVFATALRPKLLGGRAVRILKARSRTACSSESRPLTRTAEWLRLLMAAKPMSHPALATLPTTTVHLPTLRRAETFTATR